MQAGGIINTNDRRILVDIVHTRADPRIDSSQKEQLAAAAQAAGANVTTWFPENGEHVQTPAVYPQEFEQRLVGFYGRGEIYVHLGQYDQARRDLQAYAEFPEFAKQRLVDVESRSIFTVSSHGGPP